MINKILILTCVFLAQVAIAQNFKPGKVSKEELMETQNPRFPEADATILYREYKSFFTYNQSKGFELMTTVFERIKIYNPEGFSWGSKKIKTYNYGKDREQLESLKAVTFNLVDGDIEKDKLSKSNVFEERLNNYYESSSFTLPNLKAGSVIEIAYKISSPFIAIDNIDLQYSIPVNKIFVEVKAPEFYVYKSYPNPQAALSYTYDVTDKNIEVLLRGRSGLGTANYGTFSNDNSKRDRKTGYKEKIYTLSEANIPPLKDEGFVDNLSNYQAKSIWELNYVTNSNGPPTAYASSWDDVTKSIYKRNSFSGELEKSKYYAQDLEAAIKDLTTPEEKMSAIFNLVKSKVAWNRYYGYFPDKGVKKAYQEGQGNVGDINLMLVSMLRAANLNANPVLVSTKNNGIPVFPTRYGFNYVIAQVTNAGNSYLLDATSTFNAINLLPERAMNWQGRVIRSNGTSNWVALYPTFVSNSLTYVQAEIANGDANVMVQQRLGGHFARAFRAKNYKKADGERLNGLSKNKEVVDFSELTVKDLESTKANMTLSYKANSSSVIEEINGDLYFSPMLFFAQKENPFKEETRSYPLFFDYPKSKKYNVTVKIPEGYKVKSMPEPIKAAMAEEAMLYSYLISEANGTIQLAVSIDINRPAMVADDYKYIKAIFSQIVAKENEKVVLTKL